jgi:predicted transcriptional regulator of viral defense system
MSNTERQQQILNLIAASESKTITKSELVAQLGCGPHYGKHLQVVISRMLDRGILERVRNGVYRRPMRKGGLRREPTGYGDLWTIPADMEPGSKSNERSQTTLQRTDSGT